MARADGDWPKIRADKASCPDDHLRWLRDRHLAPRIIRPGIESGERLGRHRWKVERSTSWLFGYRRRTVQYARKGSRFVGDQGNWTAAPCAMVPNRR
ncbi:hypothetical protein [Streptomyces sp. NBC_00063]|uniref:hypothetical protein n=1 Tax=Streptomyces sp. NBC_00063 TaxID=2975638 RepID=UPI003D70E9DF